MENHQTPALREQAIWTRKSTRAFDSSRAIEQQFLEYLLRAAIQAPKTASRGISLL